MALSAKVVTFTPSAGIVGTTQAITGVGFQPKAILFYFGGSNAVVDQHISIDAYFGAGLAVSATKRAAVANFIGDALATMNTQTAHRDDCCLFLEDAAGGGSIGRWDLVSMDVDGFTLIVDQAAGATPPRRVTALCLGGADITDADLIRFNGPGAIGTQDVAGLAFQPDMLFFLTSGEAGTPTDTDPTARMCLGMANAALEQGVLWGYSEDNTANSTTRRYLANDVCLMYRDNTLNPYRASLVQMNVDGFRLNWTHLVSSLPMYCLAIKGGAWKIGASATLTVVGSLPLTGFGFQPKALMLLSHANAGLNGGVAESNNMSFSVGMGISAAEQWLHSTHEQNAQATSNVWVSIDDDEMYLSASNTAITGLMELTTLDADGATLQQGDADPTARNFLYLGMGDTFVAPTGPPPGSLSLVGVGA